MEERAMKPNKTIFMFSLLVSSFFSMLAFKDISEFNLWLIVFILL